MVVSARCDTSDVIATVDMDAAPCGYSANTDNWGAVLVLILTHVCGQRRPCGMVVSARCDTNDVIATVDMDAAPCGYGANTDNWGAVLVLILTHVWGQRRPYGMVVSA